MWQICLCRLIATAPDYKSKLSLWSIFAKKKRKKLSIPTNYTLSSYLPEDALVDLVLGALADVAHPHVDLNYVWAGTSGNLQCIASFKQKVKKVKDSDLTCSTYLIVKVSHLSVQNHCWTGPTLTWLASFGRCQSPRQGKSQLSLTSSNRSATIPPTSCASAKLKGFFFNYKNLFFFFYYKNKFLKYFKVKTFFFFFVKESRQKSLCKKKSGI